MYFAPYTHNPLVPRDKIAIMRLEHHASCKRRLCREWASVAACGHNGSYRELNPQQPSCGAKSVLRHSEHRLPFFFFLRFIWRLRALSFHRRYRKRSRPAVCTSVKHFSLNLMEDEAEKGKYSRSQSRRWWIRDGGLLLTVLLLSSFFAAAAQTACLWDVPIMWRDVSHLHPKRSQRRGRYQ